MRMRILQYLKWKDDGSTLAIIICVVLLLLALILPDARGEYYELDREINRNQIIEMCDDLYENHTSHRYFCLMGNFYALDKINDYLYIYATDGEAIKKLMDLLDEYSLEDYSVVNFIAVDRLFNKWLEERDENR